MPTVTRIFASMKNGRLWKLAMKNVMWHPSAWTTSLREIRTGLSCSTLHCETRTERCRRICSDMLNLYTRRAYYSEVFLEWRRFFVVNTPPPFAWVGDFVHMRQLYMILDGILWYFDPESYPLAKNLLTRKNCGIKVFMKNFVLSMIIRIFATREPAKPLNDAQMCGSFFLFIHFWIWWILFPLQNGLNLLKNLVNLLESRGLQICDRNKAIQYENNIIFSDIHN